MFKRIKKWRAIRQLKSRNRLTRQRAEWTLRNMLYKGDVSVVFPLLRTKPSSRRVIDVLVKAQRSDEPLYATYATLALCKFKNPRIVKPLMDAIHGRTPEEAVWDTTGRIGSIWLNSVRITAVKALSKLDNAVATPALVELLNDFVLPFDDNNYMNSFVFRFQRSIASALQQIGWKPETAEHRLKFAIVSGRYVDAVAEGPECVTYLEMVTKAMALFDREALAPPPRHLKFPTREAIEDAKKLRDAWRAIQDPLAIDAVMELVKSQKTSSLQANVATLLAVQTLVRLVGSKWSDTKDQRLIDEIASLLRVEDDLLSIGPVGVREKLIHDTLVSCGDSRGIEFLLRPVETAETVLGNRPGKGIVFEARFDMYRATDYERQKRKTGFETVCSRLETVRDYLRANPSVFSTAVLQRVASVKTATLNYSTGYEIGHRDNTRWISEDHSKTTADLCNELRKMALAELSRRDTGPVSIRCPKCKKMLNGKNENLGKKVKCPTCGKTFVFEIHHE